MIGTPAALAALLAFSLDPGTTYLEVHRRRRPGWINPPGTADPKQKKKRKARKAARRAQR